jgi:hypothetical protein
MRLHNRIRGIAIACAAVIVAFLVFASSAPAVVPAGPPVFTTPLDITNEFMPFQVDAVKVFTGHSGPERTAVVDLYLEDTRTFTVGLDDVETRVLQETEFANGELAEISRNFFAQADDGSVYYFGEVVDIYENGAVVSNEGSWLVGGPTLPSDPADAGNAAAPALFMPALPEKNDTWKPEDLFPIVDETATVMRTNVRVNVPAGKFTDAIEVKETTQLDNSVGFKYYVPGVGVARTRARGETLILIASTLTQ